MGYVILIPWPATVWSEMERLASRTPLPLTSAGQAQARQWADRIAVAGLDVVYHGEEPSSDETADIVGDRCDAPHKPDPDLSEVDLGLWDGLSLDELKRRDAKTFKLWWNDPSSVCPPEGEDINDAFERLGEALKRLTKKHPKRRTGLVLGPLAFGAMRCIIESAEPARVRAMMSAVPLRYDFSGTSLTPTPTPVQEAST